MSINHCSYSGEARPAADVRAGDRERAAAAERLSAHAAAGRLSVEELEERLERVQRAIHVRDLEALEADLPTSAPRPPAGARRWPRPPLVLAALLVTLVAASLFAGHPVAPLALVALFLLWRAPRRRWTAQRSA